MSIWLSDSLKVTVPVRRRLVKMRNRPRRALHEYQYDYEFHLHLSDLVLNHWKSTGRQYQNIQCNLLLHMYCPTNPFSLHYHMLLAVSIENYNEYLRQTLGEHRGQIHGQVYLENDNDHQNGKEHFPPQPMILEGWESHPDHVPARPNPYWDHFLGNHALKMGSHQVKIDWKGRKPIGKIPKDSLLWTEWVFFQNCNNVRAFYWNWGTLAGTSVVFSKGYSAMITIRPPLKYWARRISSRSASINLTV